jgi:hypothetical protein
VPMAMAIIWVSMGFKPITTLHCILHGNTWEIKPVALVCFIPLQSPAFPDEKNRRINEQLENS